MVFADVADDIWCQLGTLVGSGFRRNFRVRFGFPHKSPPVLKSRHAKISMVGTFLKRPRPTFGSFFTQLNQVEQMNTLPPNFSGENGFDPILSRRLRPNSGEESRWYLGFLVYTTVWFLQLWNEYPLFRALVDTFARAYDESPLFGRIGGVKICTAKTSQNVNGPLGGLSLSTVNRRTKCVSLLIRFAQKTVPIPSCHIICLHPPNSTPHNSNNSYSVVDKRASRSNQNKPIDTPSKQERNAFTTSSNRPTPFRSLAYPTTTQTL